MAKMVISKDDATALLVAVGFVIAPKWDAAKLKERLSALNKVEGVKEKVAAIDDEAVKKLGLKTLAACAQGVQIFVTETVPLETEDEAGESQEDADVSDETEGEIITPPMKKAKQAATTKKPVKPAAKPTKPVKPEKPAAKKEEKADKPKKVKSEVKKDPWGTREGTRTARINAVFLKAGKAYEVKEIETASNSHGIHSHLTKLKQEGLIERTADGKYQATKKGMSKKPAKK